MAGNEVLASELRGRGRARSLNLWSAKELFQSEAGGLWTRSRRREEALVGIPPLLRTRDNLYRIKHLRVCVCTHTLVAKKLA